jgi:plasmid stabilization system protein ParE
MAITLPIKRMSREDKLRAMEALWADLSKDDSDIDSADWHATVLGETEQLVRSGKAKFSDWQTAKSRLRRKAERTAWIWGFLTAQKPIYGGFRFYQRKSRGVGWYFFETLSAEIESLHLYAGVHRKYLGYFRMLSRRFPYAIYYRVVDDEVQVWRVQDCRRDPGWIRRQIRLKSWQNYEPNQEKCAAFLTTVQSLWKQRRVVSGMDYGR